MNYNKNKYYPKQQSVHFLLGATPQFPSMLHLKNTAHLERTEEAKTKMEAMCRCARDSVCFCLGKIYRMDQDDSA